jgi:hypothetical protein
MGRPLRMARGEFVYHVLNRANGRVPLFDDDGDYAAFERVLAEACERVSMRMLAYCVMPNHWHVVLWPRQDGALSRFMSWLTFDPHATVACAAPHEWPWASLSRALQVVRDRTERPSAHAMSSAMRCAPGSWSEPSSGDGAVLGTVSGVWVLCG